MGANSFKTELERHRRRGGFCMSGSSSRKGKRRSWILMAIKSTIMGKFPESAITDQDGWMKGSLARILKLLLTYQNIEWIEVRCKDFFILPSWKKHVLNQMLQFLY